MLRDRQTPELIKSTRCYCGRFFLVCSFLLLVSSENALADAIALESPIAALAIGTWSGSGTVDFDSQDFCVGSVDGTSFSYTTANYKVKVTNNTAGSIGQFRLLNGTHSLPITMVYTDLYSSAAQETLIEGSWTLTAKRGSTDCNLKNGGISVVISEAALLAVPSGVYQETMAIYFQQLSPATASSSSSFNVSTTVPDLVRIGNLNDISLGSWSGAGNRSNSDAVCIYKNSPGTYAITFTGDGGSGPGTAFLLTNNSEDLAYAVAYNDGTGNVTVSPGVKLTGRTGHHQTSATCGGATNATVTVTILESIIESAPSDNYHGTLTLLVSPQ